LITTATFKLKLHSLTSPYNLNGSSNILREGNPMHRDQHSELLAGHPQILVFLLSGASPIRATQWECGTQSDNINAGATNSAHSPAVRAGA
jgi:hypothetical protein